MIVNRLGYACINDTLSNRTPRISTSRTIRKETYDKEGLAKVSYLAIQNLKDLLKILMWNENKGIKLFRMSSDIFPWISLWQWDSLKRLGEIENLLGIIGKYAEQSHHRLTFHPGHFIKLCSPNEDLVNNGIKELEHHNRILNIMGFEPSVFNSINIHIGAAYGNKVETLERFNKNYEKLSDSLKQRLTVENDDKSALYTTEELYEGVYKKIGVPIMFDFHHYRCNPDKNMCEQEAANLAIKTWPSTIVPKFHWSESRRDQDTKCHAAAHSDLCYGPLPDYTLLRPIDLMIEAKKKEKSFPLLKYANGSTVHKSSHLQSF